MSKKSIYAQLNDYVQQKCADYYQEVRKILPDLPKTMKFSFDNSVLTEVTASGGYAKNHNHIVLAFDPFFSSSGKRKEADLRAAVFHESYHIAQDFTYAHALMKPIANAIGEGAATVFEREFAGSEPTWGKYSKEVAGWVDEVKKLGDDYGGKWNEWKYYDPETDRKWILYKVGTYIVDQALTKNPKISVVDLANKKADEILKLAKL